LWVLVILPGFCHRCKGRTVTKAITKTGRETLVGAIAVSEGRGGRSQIGSEVYVYFFFGLMYAVRSPQVWQPLRMMLRADGRRIRRFGNE
jgi:hypothetical protein